MEYWSDGKNPILQHSNTPILELSVSRVEVFVSRIGVGTLFGDTREVYYGWRLHGKDCVY